MIIGITGGTGCGKTTLLDIIQEEGGTVIDCDAVYHQLLRSDAALLQSINDRFPGTVEDGKLQRKRLGDIVFRDRAALEDLNQITHAAVKQKVIAMLAPEPALAAIDAIGLFESGLNELCKLTVAVNASWQKRVQRLMARDGIDQEYAMARITSQPSGAEFAARCDHVLVNDDTKEAFREKCLAFLREQGIINT